MASKTSFFNKTLYLKQIKRFAPWSLLYMIFVFMLETAYPILELISSLPIFRDDLAAEQGYMVYNYADSAQILIPLGAACSSLIFAALLYSYIYTENAVNTMHALPIRREAHILTNFAAGLTLIICPTIIPFFITGIYYAANGLTIAATLFLHMFLLHALCAIIFFSLATFATVLVGNTVSLPLIYIVTNLVSLWLYVLIAAAETYFIYGISSVNFPKALEALAPVLKLSTNLIFTYTDSLSSVSFYLYTANYKLVLLYDLGALILLAISVLIYRRRKLETTGEMLSVKCVAYPLQFIIGSGVGLVFAFYWYAIGDYHTDLPVILSFFIGSAIGYLGSCMILRRRFNIFRECLLSFIIYCAIFLVFILAFMLDIFDIASYVPKASEIDTVYFNYGTYTDDADVIELVQAFHKEILEYDEDAISHEDTDPYTTLYFYISYQLDNGLTISRSYTLTVWEKDLEYSDSFYSKFMSLMSNERIALMYYFDVTEFDTEWVSYITFYSYDYVLDGDTYEYDYDTDTYVVVDTDGDNSYVYQDNFSYITNEEAISIADAILADLAEGNLPVYTTYYYQLNYDEDGNSTWKEYCSVNQYAQSIGIDFTPSGYSASDYYGYAHISLKSDMVNTISILEELGYISEENPLILQSDYDDSNYWY